MYRIAAINADVQLGVGQIVEQRNVEAVLLFHADITVVGAGLQFELMAGQRVDLLLFDQFALAKSQIAQFSNHFLLEHLVAAVESNDFDVLSNQILNLLFIFKNLNQSREEEGEVN